MANCRSGDVKGTAEETIRRVYELLFNAYGPQHWWPADTPTEVVIGAILTQNTAWTNVERAIENLKEADCLDFAALRDIAGEELAQLIRPSGTYRVKAARLKAFVDVLWDRHDGSLSELLAGEVEQARERLLSINGIGPETADAILLYAGERPSFVVDAYTRRILQRHHLIDGTANYDDVRDLFHRSLDSDPRLFNEYHALLVRVGKEFCLKRKPKCENCPLKEL